jgi:chromosome partitioning protein
MRTSIVPSCGAQLQPHVVVIGNQKGGSGKSTFAMHIIVALLKAGKRVASFDLDLSQLTLTRYLNNRREWAQEHKLELELPDHYSITEEIDDSNAYSADLKLFISKFRKPKDDYIDDNTSSHTTDLKHFISQLKKIEQACKHDFIVIDTPGGVQHLSLIAHGIAATLITPINDSLLDLDVLVAIERRAPRPRPSSYAKTVRRALDARQKVSGRATDWIVVRNRLELVLSNNHRQISRILDVIRPIVGFRMARGLLERPVYREFFASGLTAFDAVGTTEPDSPPDLLARVEVGNLIRELRLLDDYQGVEDEVFQGIECEIAETNK